MKLQKISDIAPMLPFTEFDMMKKFRKSFEKSELGQIRSELPLAELAAEFKSCSGNSKVGRKSIFPPEGEIALMFLKPYTGLSDDALMEMLNGSIHMQMFCGIIIDPENPIKDGKIVSAIRNRLGRVMDIRKLQAVLFKKWGSKLENKDLCLTDATCYESHLRYPTDEKLLWECCEWFFKLLKSIHKCLSMKFPRTKYKEIEKARLAHAKKRHHRQSSTKRLKRRLLKLLSKLLGIWNTIAKAHGMELNLDFQQCSRLLAIRMVYRQQKDLFDGKTIKDRVVSIDRPYIRPIVRGKENKRVEFGAKVNNIQIDGLSFIEHLSYDAFNEGIRLKECIEYQEILTGIKVKRVGADTIYANNANRTYCSENGITTCFARKGPRPKEEAAELRTARRIIGNLRATVMEGSFGNQKLHYSLGRIKARNEYSETLLLFFGIHMANAATLAARNMESNSVAHYEQTA